MIETDKNTVLQVENLTAGYGSKIVLENVSLDVCKGKILGIIGENGSGKSTLLKTISGLISPISGTVELNGRRGQPSNVYNLVNNGVSFFTQGGLIMPDLTVQEHLMLATMSKKDNNEETNFPKVFDKFPQLSKHRQKRAGTLSGGEKQMLSFGILMVQGTKTWLLDEPTAGLSPDMVQRTTKFLQQMNQEEDITMVLAEHNMDVAFKLSENITITKNKTLMGKFTQQDFNENNFLSRYLYN